MDIQLSLLIGVSCQCFTAIQQDAGGAGVVN